MPIITSEDFEKLRNLKVDYSLKPAWVLFLIQCLTGLRYSDAQRLSQSNIVKETIDGKEYVFLDCINKKTLKKIRQDITKDDFLIDLLKQKINYRGSFSENKMNKCIKKICKMAKLDTPFESVKKEGGEKIFTSAPKWQLITSHTGRRSYITNMHNLGVDYMDIKDLTGISSDSTLATYLYVTDFDKTKRLINSSIPNNPYTSGQRKLEIGKAS